VTGQIVSRARLRSRLNVVPSWALALLQARPRAHDLAPSLCLLPFLETFVETLVLLDSVWLSPGARNHQSVQGLGVGLQQAFLQNSSPSSIDSWQRLASLTHYAENDG
jgi:hypothetical protein